MDAKAYPLNQILAFERRYVVPTYQRDYEWTREGQWQLLFNDLEQVAERLDTARARARAAGHDVVKADKEVGPHFLGAIVLDQLPSSAGSIDLRAVIDGQQRLTTLGLLIRGLLDALDAGNPRAAQLRRLLRNPDDTGSPDERYKLWPRRRDRDAWRLVMAEACDPVSKHVYVEARRYFAQRARTYIGADQKSDERASLLVDAILGLFKLVVIDLEDNDDAQVIFEVLNGRQTPLSAADLVKNLLFLRAELASAADLEAMYEKYWADFDDPWWKKEVGRGHAARRHADMLLAAWLTAATEEEATAGRLYGEIRAYLDASNRPVTDVLAEINHYGAEYRIVNAVGPEVDPRIRKAYERLIVLGMTTAMPLLLWLRMQHRAGLSMAEHRRAVVAVESFVMRRVLLGAQTRGYGRAFAQVLGNVQKAIRDKAMCVSEAVEAELRKKPQGAHWPSDDEVVTACSSRRFYGVDSRQRLRLILGALDEYLRQANPKTEKAVFDYDALTIEHIMPRAWRDWWPILAQGEAEMSLAAQRRDAMVDKLGNLTLVTTILNPSLSNASWLGKRAELSKHSALALNADVVIGDSWDETGIDERSASLGRTACSVWPRPPVLNEDELAGPDGMPARGGSSSFEWARTDAGVGVIPTGYWTTYGDLAEVGGTGPQSVGNRMASPDAPSNAYRVLDRLGRISPAFRWPDPADTRDVRSLLEQEGVSFTSDGRADPVRRLSAYQLAQLIPDRFSEEELERLAVADESRRVSAASDGEGPWVEDGQSWHLSHMCSEKTRAIVQELTRVIGTAAPDVIGPDWGQKHYVAWRVGSHIWLRVITKRSLVWLQFRTASLPTETVAERLGAVHVRGGESASSRASGPIQVASSAYWPLKIMFRNPSDVVGAGAERLRGVIQQEWQALSWRRGESVAPGSDAEAVAEDADVEDPAVVPG